MHFVLLGFAHLKTWHDSWWLMATQLNHQLQIQPQGASTQPEKPDWQPDSPTDQQFDKKLFGSNLLLDAALQWSSHGQPSAQQPMTSASLARSPESNKLVHWVHWTGFARNYNWFKFWLMIEWCMHASCILASLQFPTSTRILGSGTRRH